eukprot:484425-Rhodomonas_salina.4
MEKQKDSGRGHGGDSLWVLPSRQHGTLCTVWQCLLFILHQQSTPGTCTIYSRSGLSSSPQHWLVRLDADRQGRDSMLISAQRRSLFSLRQSLSSQLLPHSTLWRGASWFCVTTLLSSLQVLSDTEPRRDLGRDAASPFFLPSRSLALHHLVPSLWHSVT